jgi:phenylacetate-CoA ligase
MSTNIRAHLDEPVDGQDDWYRFPLAGWVVPPASFSDIRARAGNRDLEIQYDPESRPDVGSAFPAIPGAEKGGFRGFITLPPIEGAVTIDVYGIRHDGSRQPVGSRTVSNNCSAAALPPQLYHEGLGTPQAICRNQWTKKEKIAEFQERMLRRLVRYAYAEIPFYKHRFRSAGLKPSDIRSLDDLVKIPVLTKRDLVANYNSVVNPAFVHGTHRSGGTTGLRLKWAFSRACADLFPRTLWRGLGWSGWTPDKKIISFYSRVIGSVTEKSLIFREAFSPARIEQDLEAAEKFSPDYAYCYASSAYLVARYLLRERRTLPLSGVITTSDTLFPHYRKMIGEAFCCDVYNNYGCGDGGAWGAECSEHTGFHQDFERSIIEFDETGRMLVTDLWNYAMPFIRYENGDTGEFIGKDCPCGRDMPLFHVIGRINDCIILPDRIIPPVTISQLLIQPALLDIRVIQHATDHCEIQYEPSSGYGEKECISAMSSFLPLLEGCTVEIHRVDTIERPSSDKQRIIENRSGLTIESYMENIHRA